MYKLIDNIEFDNTISLTKYANGWWLYDATREMNLSIKAKSREDAFFEALKYYQNRLLEIENANRKMRSRIDDFISQFTEDDDYP